jgi:hypothetical protein
MTTRRWTLALTEKQIRSTPAHPAPTDLRPKDDEHVSRRWALTLMAAWFVLFPLALSLEPVPASTAAEPWWGYVASFALLGAIATTFVGLSRRASWGYKASFVAGSIFVGGVFACPATGHHAFGLWWFGEMAIALTLVTLSAVAYLRRA